MNSRLLLSLFLVAVLPQTRSPQRPQVVRNTEPAEPPRTVELEEIWRVGGEEDDHVFGLMIDARCDADGNVYLLDQQLSRVTMVSPDGRIPGRTGRRRRRAGRMPHAPDLDHDARRHHRSGPAVSREVHQGDHRPTYRRATWPSAATKPPRPGSPCWFRAATAGAPCWWAPCTRCPAKTARPGIPICRDCQPPGEVLAEFRRALDRSGFHQTPFFRTRDGRPVHRRPYGRAGRPGLPGVHLGSVPDRSS